MNPSVVWALVLLAAFLVLTASLQIPLVHRLDTAGSAWLCDRGGPHITQLSRFLARIGSTGLYLAIPLMGVLGWLCGRAAALKTYLFLLAGHCCLLFATKFIVARPRPDSLSSQKHLDSFPSGHTLIAVILAGSFLIFVLPHCRKRWQRGLVWAGVVFWPLLMGLSRIQWGRHYITDVLAAWLVGIAWLLLCATMRGWSGKAPKTEAPQFAPALAHHDSTAITQG